MKMNQRTWSRVHLGWVVDKGLSKFSVKTLGQSIAGLKLFLTLAGLAGRPGGKPDFLPIEEVRLTYEELEEHADVGRALIRPGLDLLEELVQITPGTGQTASTYRLPYYGDRPWAKVPSGRLLIGPKHRVRGLKHFSLRSRASLGALKMYLVLLAFRDRKTGCTQLTIERIGDYAFLGKTDLSQGRSILVGAELVSVFSPHSDNGYDGTSFASNRYVILGHGLET